MGVEAGLKRDGSYQFNDNHKQGIE